jgi:peptide/nickel transport system permease protein
MTDTTSVPAVSGQLTPEPDVPVTVAAAADLEATDNGKSTMRSRRKARGQSTARKAKRHIYIGAALLLGLIAICYFYPRPFDPLATSVGPVSQGPTGEFWFGTDSLGRDIFSRVLTAGRTDILLVLAATLITTVAGTLFGLLSASENIYTEAFMRFLDVFQALPLLVVTMALVSVSGNSLVLVVFAVAMIRFPTVTRLVRSEAIGLRQSRFIEAARATGASPFRVLRSHLLPNVSGIVIVNAVVSGSMATISIAGLAFLNIGVQPPDPSWGGMIQQGVAGITTGQWWVWVFPGLCVLLLGMSFNRLGDGFESLQNRRGRA